MRVYLHAVSSGHTFSLQLLDKENGKNQIGSVTNEISYPQDFCHLQPIIQAVNE